MTMKGKEASRRKQAPVRRTLREGKTGKRSTQLSVTMVASEGAPYAKTGGLADVTVGLSSALTRLGHAVTLVVPRYGHATGSGTPVDRFAIRLGGRSYEAGFFQDELEGVKVVLVDSPEFYDRDGIYGLGTQDYPDNARRFAFLARAALELTIRSGVRPSIIHAHDWQASLVPVYLKTRYREDPVLGGVPTVFTIHNLSYQGLFSPAWMQALDLPPELFTLQALEYWGQVSFLKGGITFSEMITTVSERYAQEIQQGEFGFGFQGVLRARADDLQGIVNGIDTMLWDPATDPYIAAHFSREDPAGKQECKRALHSAFMLPTDALRPTIGMVSRLIDQKGLDLIFALAERLPEVDASFVVLGTGEPRYELMWRTLAERHPDRFGARIGFDEPLAHQIEAGADIFLMPSRFEPCGLNQMYSMRYGTIPVVRAVGGLDDTVEQYNPRTGRGTGFKFAEYEPQALLRTLEEAIGVYRSRKPHWKRLMAAGMSRDFSWEPSAKRYVKVYDAALKKARNHQEGRVPVGARER